MYTIGVDIGGMSVKVGLVDDNGKIISQSRVKTEKTAEEVIVKMVDQINELLKNNSVKLGELRGIGIGCPGAVSSDKGIVEFLPNSNLSKSFLSLQCAKILFLISFDMPIYT